MPDETAQTTFTSCRGKTYTVLIDAWYDLLMHGERKPVSIPMHSYPFTLLRIRLFNTNGELAYGVCEPCCTNDPARLE